MSYTLTGNITGILGITNIVSSDLTYMSDGDKYVNGPTISVGETAEFIIDLYNRYYTLGVYYYYSGGGVVSMYVEESFGYWVQVFPSVILGGLFIGLTGVYPKRVKVVHLASLSLVTAHELQIYNKDTLLVFDFDKVALDSSGVLDTMVSVYNSSTGVKDINVFVSEGSGVESVALSYSGSGPYYFRYEKGLILPGAFSWDSGRHINTVVSGTNLTISGVSVSGTYYSPVVDLYGYSGYRVFWDEFLPDGDFIGFIDNSGSERCIGVRSSYIAPVEGWSSGSLASESDPFWSIADGSLNFLAAPKEIIIADDINRYSQFCITITGSITNKPYIKKAGFETPITISGVQPSTYANIYIRNNEDTSGKTAGIITWYTEQ